MPRKAECCKRKHFCCPLCSMDKPCPDLKFHRREFAKMWYRTSPKSYRNKWKIAKLKGTNYNVLIIKQKTKIVFE